AESVLLEGASWLAGGRNAAHRGTSGREHTMGSSGQVLSTLRRFSVPTTIGVFVASVVASGANPRGFTNWLAIYRTMGGGFTPKISEWMPIFRYEFLPNAPVYLLVAVMAAVLILARREIVLFELMTVLALGTACILRTRFVPLFTIA